MADGLSYTTNSKRLVFYFFGVAVFSIYFAVTIHELGHYIWFVASQYCVGLPQIQLYLPIPNGQTLCTPKDPLSELSPLFYLGGISSAFIVGSILTVIFATTNSIRKDPLWAFPVYLFGVSCIINSFLQLIQSSDAQLFAVKNSIRIDLVKLGAVLPATILIIQFFLFRFIKKEFFKGNRLGTLVGVIYISSAILFCTIYVFLFLFYIQLIPIIRFLGIL